MTSITEDRWSLAKPGPFLAFAGMMLLAGCLETVDGTSDFGAGRDTAGGASSGRIVQTTDGDYLFTLSRAGAVCTARFEGGASAGSTDLQNIACTDGGRGTATVVYGSGGAPDRVVYAVNGEGGGTINF